MNSYLLVMKFVVNPTTIKFSNKEKIVNSLMTKIEADFVLLNRDLNVDFSKLVLMIKEDRKEDETFMSDVEKSCRELAAEYSMFFKSFESLDVIHLSMN